MPEFKSTCYKFLSLLGISAALNACDGGGSGNDNKDITAPTVSSVTPENGANNVSRSAPVSATFSEEMFAVSVDGTGFSLTKSSNPVPATISLNTTTNSVSLQPNSKLHSLSRYSATLTTSLTDLSGNALNENFSWSFTTEDGNWGTATLLESDTGEASSPQIAIDNSGNALAVWMQNESIWANRYSKTNGSWGTPTLIEAKTGIARLPKISTDSNGNAVAVWIQFDDLQFSIWANRYTIADGSWGQAVLIEQSVEDATVPEIAVDSNGNALAVWSQWNIDRYSIWANRYSVTNDSWGTVELIGGIPDDASYPQIEVDASGNALAVWYQREGTQKSIWGNRYDMSNDSWGTAKRIGTDGGVVRPSGSFVDNTQFIPRIAIDDSGNAWTVWSQTDGTRDNIWASRYSVANDSWGTAMMIETNDGDARAPQISVDSSGNALAIWYQSDGSLDTTRFNRYSVSSSSWGTAAPIAPNAGQSYAQQISYDNSGNALAVWKEADGAKFDIRACRYNADDGSWSTSALIETDTGSADNPQIAIASSGDALAVWEQDDDAQNTTQNSIRANSFE